MKFKHDKIEEIELLHTEALADRLQFLALSERNPKVSLWLSHSADRLQIQLKDNADLRRQLEEARNELTAARKDSERLDWVLSECQVKHYLDSWDDSPTRIAHRDDIDEIRSSQTDNDS